MPATLASLPTLPGLPLVGHAFAFARDPLGLVDQLRDFGPIVPIRLGSFQLAFVREPALIEEAMVRRKDHLRKDRVTRRLSQVLGQGLLTSEGEPWQRNRRLIAPVFGPRQMAPLASVMADCSRTFAASLPEGVVDLRPRLMSLTLDIVVRTLFDPSLHGAVGHLGAHVDRMVEAAGQEADGLAAFLPLWVPLPSRRTLARERAALDAIFFDLVRRRRAAGEGGSDLLGRLLSARDDDGTALSDEQLRDELVTLFIAGHETTAVQLSWTLHLLAHHRDVQEALVAEQRAVLGDREAEAADLGRLPLQEAVLSESLRLYPPAWILGREVVTPFELGGVHIPAGTELDFSPWLLHRDARFWPDPLAFRPARWQNGEAEAAPRQAYFPFGVGNRSCVGQSFARLEAGLALATLLRRWSFAPGDRGPAVPSPAITLRPKDGLYLEIRRRA